MDRLDSPAIEWSMIICTARWDILQFSGTARCCQTPSQVQPWREFPVHHFHWLHWSSWKRRSPVGPIRFLVCGQVSLNRISRAGRFFFFYVRISLETKRPKFHPKNICESIKSLIKHDGFLVVFNVGMGYCLFLPFLACNPYIKKDQRDHRRDAREKKLIFLKNTELKFWPVVSAFYVIVRANSASKGRCVPTQFWGSQAETNTFGLVIAVHGSIPVLSTNYGSTNTSVKRTQILSNLCFPKVKFYVYICISNTWVIIHIYILY